MEKPKNNKIVITLLALIIIILSVLCILFATGTISFNSNKVNDNDTNKNETNINNEQNLIDTVKITNFTFGKPYAGGFGGGGINTLVIDTNINLDCSNDAIVGIRLSGYCLDTEDNKYVMGGPVGVMAFYCDNNASHVDSGHMISGQVFDSNGNEVDTNNIKWAEKEIKYCKVDEARFVGTDGDLIPSLSKKINYEKNFLNNTSQTNYKEYNIYDEVILKDGSKWMVIENSSKDSDYVTLIKKEDIEVTGNTGDQLMDEFFNSTTTYDNSKLKKYLNSVTNTIPVKLKEVNGYKIRLITVEEIMKNDNNWTYDKTYDYYTYNGNNSNISTFVGLTMTNPKCTEGKCSAFYVVGAAYNDNQKATYYIDHWASGLPQIKPVINVYKTELDK